MCWRSIGSNVPFLSSPSIYLFRALKSFCLKNFIRKVPSTIEILSSLVAYSSFFPSLFEFLRAPDSYNASVCDVPDDLSSSISIPSCGRGLAYGLKCVDRKIFLPPEICTTTVAPSILMYCVIQYISSDASGTLIPGTVWKVTETFRRSFIF